MRPDTPPRFATTKTLVERLQYVVEDFGEDRQRDVAFLGELLGRELNSAEATLANTYEELWLPRFLAVVNSICEHLEIPVSKVLAPGIASHAESLSVEADLVVRQVVKGLIAKAKYAYSRLTDDEIAARVAVVPEVISDARTVRKFVARCPACENVALLRVSPGRMTGSMRTEPDGKVVGTVTHLATGLACRICGLVLDDTAKVVAAGIPRRRTVEYSERRSESGIWEGVFDPPAENR